MIFNIAWGCTYSSFDVEGSLSTSSKKRGPARGKELIEGSKKKFITTNEHGQPNALDYNLVDFSTSLGVLTRTNIPITYTNIRDVPCEHIQMVINGLGRNYEFEHESVWLDYVPNRMKACWRNYKTYLYTKFIKGKDPAVVKQDPAPAGVPIEDWITFVDQRNSQDFLELSARNASNRAKQVGPSTLGRRSLAVTRHQMVYVLKYTSYYLFQIIPSIPSFH